MKVAVVGSGIAGLSAAHAMVGKAEVTLFEAGKYFGGHANTVDVALDGMTHGVDTGFLVYNERTYPGLIRLFEQLGVETAASDMSFSVQVPQVFGEEPLEWSGVSLDTVFCQRPNMVRPRFWRMLRDLLRFNSLATAMAQAGHEPGQSLQEFLAQHRFSDEFRDWYLLPMIGCIWSSPGEQMLRFPVGALVRFCHNHGLLQIANRPQWFTVKGGSREYVRRIVERIQDKRLETPVLSIERGDGFAKVTSKHGTETFDRLVLATHPDQSLAMLRDATWDEQEVLGAIAYQPNRAVLHTDVSMLPRNPRAWAAWNYESGLSGDGTHVCLHYLINKLQPLPWERPVVVSLNPLRPIHPANVIQEIEYSHPVFDAAALAAQGRLVELQGKRATWFCGAWTANGFHEDGLVSGQEAAKSLLVRGRIQEVAGAMA